MNQITITRKDGSTHTVECEAEKTSDGHHSFKELYDHRCLLFIGLMNSHPDISWFSKKHHDGTHWAGWIIAGMNLSSGSITYHIPSLMSGLLNVQELTLAPEWDGHTSEDVIQRLEVWLQRYQSPSS